MLQLLHHCLYPIRSNSVQEHDYTEHKIFTPDVNIQRVHVTDIIGNQAKMRGIAGSIDDGDTWGM